MNLFKQYMNLGIKDTYSEFLVRRIKFINITNSISILILSVLSVLSYIFGIKNILYMHLFRVVGLSVSLFFLFNYKYYVAIFITLFIFFSSTILASIVFEYQNIVHLGIFLVCAISFYFYPKHWWNIFFFFLSAITFVLIHRYNVNKPVISSPGDYIGIIVIFVIYYLLFELIVFEYKHYEKELKQKNENLLQSNIQLKEKNEKLESLNMLKDDFLSIIAHDLRNPINSIQGFATLLYSNPNLPDEKKEIYARNILVGAKGAHELLLNTLNWVKSNTGTLVVNKTNFYLSELIDEVVYSSKLMTISKEIEYINNCDKNLVVLQDRDLLSIILRNLITNAIKYSYSKSNIVISVEKENKNISIHIVDFGVGMSEEEIKNIVHIHQRQSKMGTTNEKGTGLGINLCLKLSELINAELKIESKQGKGTDVSITFPLDINSTLSV